MFLKPHFHPQCIRRFVGWIYRTIKEETGKYPESCALLAPTSSGVAQITAALNSGEKPIPHKVLFDETQVILASRIAAFLLEPKTDANYVGYVSMFLELLATLRRSRGYKTDIQEADKLLRWADQIRKEKSPRSRTVLTAYNLIREVQKIQFNGIPQKDWPKVKEVIQASPD